MEVPAVGSHNYLVSEVVPSDNGRWRQFYACFAMSLICVSQGFIISWSSPMMQILLSDDSPVGKLDHSQINLLLTLQQISGFVGIFIVSFILIKFGAKICGYIQAIVSVAGWVLLLTAVAPGCLYAGRFLIGTTTIGAEILASFYLSEVSNDTRRGMLIVLSVFAGKSGTLLGYLLGTVCGYRLFNGLCLIPSVLFPIFFYWIPDSPSLLVRRGLFDEAARSHSWFQGISLEEGKLFVETHIKATESENFQPKIIFQKKSNRRALLIITFISAFTQLCGISVISAYASEIFQKAKSRLTPNQSALILAVVDFLSSLVAAIIIDKIGRRFLAISSLILMAISLYGVTGYFIALDNNPSQIRSIEWLIYMSLGCFFVANALGIVTVMQTIGSELVPAGVKGIIWLIAGMAILIVSIVTVKAYDYITIYLPYYVNFLQEAIFCTVAVIIAWYIIPETKGKSLEEITAELSGEKNQAIKLNGRKANETQL